MAWYHKSVNYSNPKKKGRFKRIEINKDLLISEYRNGTPVKTLCVIFNCSKPTITRHIKFLIPNAIKRNKGATGNPELKINKLIINLYKKKYSTIYIGKLLNKDDEFVRQRLIKLKITRKSRIFKNILLYHPKHFYNKKTHEYSERDAKDFNRQFLYYYCMMYKPKRIAQLLHIDEKTVKRRIQAFRNIYVFKLRQCETCNRLFKSINYKAQRCHKCDPKSDLKVKSKLTSLYNPIPANLK